MIEVELKYGFKEQWFTYKDLSVIGFVFGIQNEVVSHLDLVKKFENIESSSEFEEVLKPLNGNFAVVINKPNLTLFAVDRLRTYPLLYTQQLDNLLITDNVSSQRVKDLKDNLTAQNQLVDFWCVLNNDTLKEGLFQLQAGEYACFKNGKIAIRSYYKHYSQEKFEDTEEVFSELTRMQDSYFEKWFEIIKDKEVWIPLSGGYDSRYLLAMLVKYGHTNLHTYTYGKKDGFEAVYAQKVAQQLGVPNHFVEYTKDLFEVFFEDIWKKYSTNNHFYTSLPHEQDFFALHQLKNIISKNSFILPGFTGDFLGGSQIIEDNNQISKVYKTIEKSFSVSLDSNLQYIDIELDIDLNDAYQNWFLKEKISKFIINSSRVYNHFGFNYLLPLWDIEWVNFWYKVPTSLRENQFLYHQYLDEKIFKPFKIDFHKPKNELVHKVKQQVKKVVPNSFLTNYAIKNRKQEVNNLNVLYELIFDKFHYKVNDFHINRIHAAYFIHMIDK